MTEITVNADGTLSCKWVGRKGGGSLFQLSASSNCEAVNKLDAVELWAVFLAVKTAPFPLGKGEAIYKMVLEEVKNHPEKCFKDGKLPDMPLGELRKGMVHKAGEGCNAPTDSYLRIAVEVKEGKKYVHSY